MWIITIYYHNQREHSEKFLTWDRAIQRYDQLVSVFKVGLVSYPKEYE